MTKEAIKKQGRPSEYESAIVSIIKEAPQGTHLTAPEVFAKAQGLGLPVSISTVYRTLHRLKSMGDLSTVSGDRKMRYEASDGGPEHDHLICLSCGLTIEFVDQRLPDFGLAVAKRKGFTVIKSRFDILGYCENCRQNDNEDRKSKFTGLLHGKQTFLKQALELSNKLSQNELTQDNLDNLLRTNRQIEQNVQKALEICQSIDKLLQRGVDSLDR